MQVINTYLHFLRTDWRGAFFPLSLDKCKFSINDINDDQVKLTTLVRLSLGRFLFCVTLVSGVVNSSIS